MEKCNEKIVVIESFDQNTSMSRKSDPALGTDQNSFYQQFNDLGTDENIILCWENFSIPLQELVKTISSYEKNMLEYYRLAKSKNFM